MKFREGADKGRQVRAGPPRVLFEEKFERIFQGEALSEVWRDGAERRVLIRDVQDVPDRRPTRISGGFERNFSRRTSCLLLSSLLLPSVSLILPFIIDSPSTDAFQ